MVTITGGSPPRGDYLSVSQFEYYIEYCGCWFNWWSIVSAFLPRYFKFTSPTTMPKSAPALYSVARTSDSMHGSKGAAFVSRLWQEPGELVPWGRHGRVLVGVAWGVPEVAWNWALPAAPCPPWPDSSEVTVSVITSWPRLSHRPGGVREAPGPAHFFLLLNETLSKSGAVPEAPRLSLPCLLF